MENSMEVPQKIKNWTTMCYCISTSRYLSEGNKNNILKRYMHHHVHCSIIYNSQDKCPLMGLPWWRSGWESTCQCRGHGFKPWSRKIPHATEQLSPCTTTTEPTCCNYWSPHARAHAPQQEKPPQWEARALQLGVAPFAATRESPRAATKTQHSQK